MSMKVYEGCPEYETESLRLRLVRREDAQELLSCYSDRKAVERINEDNCVFGFLFETLSQMEDCIDYWLKEYDAQSFVRFAVIAKDSGKAVGTLEIFGGEAGVLRMELAGQYDRECFTGQLVRLACF